METEQAMEQLTTFATTYGLKIVGAILILIIGRIVAGIAKGMVKRVMGRANADETVIGFTANIVYWAILAFAVVAALAKFGVQTASFVAILGAASFAVGMALQGSLANFASGVMLLIFRPIKAGDYVEAAGVAGSVKSIELFTTVLATPDNVKIVVPNGKLFGDIIKNYSAYDTRRVDWLIGIGYGCSIGQAMEVINGVINSDDRVLKDPEPMIAVGELADSSVNLVVRAWVNSSDYWGVKFDLSKAIKEALDANGIEIPFPQRVVHMQQ